MWITFLNPLKDYVLSHFFNQTQQNAIKRNMYSYLTTDQKALDSNSPGRATKTRGNVDFRGFLFTRNSRAPDDWRQNFVAGRRESAAENENPRFATGVFLLIVCLFIVCDDADRLEQSAKDRKIFVIGIDGGVGSAVKSVGDRD